MSDWAVLFFTVLSVGAGLLLGRWLWAVRTAFLEHNPACPNKAEVLDNARRVQIDIDELTRSAHG